MDIKEVITTRKSTRTYRDEAITADAREKLEAYMAQVTSPFDIKTRFALIDAERAGLQGERLGTYGVITGAKNYIAAITEKAERYEENLGYAFEQIILYATSLGLDTCWLGGTFQRAAVARVLDLKDNEVLPIISPVGYAKDSRSLIDSLFVKISSSYNRKDWSELFFEDRLGNPLEKGRAGHYAEVLDMVRLAPSASNKQPWRIVKCGDMFHIYLCRTPWYRRILRFDLQRLDMGIAMCHFDLMAHARGLTGKWVDKNPGLPTDKHTQYLITYAP